MKLILALGGLICGPAAVAVLLGPAAGRADTPKKEKFDNIVRDDFFDGFRGNKEAMACGMKICDDALKANPKNAEAMVWHGCGLNYQAGMAYQKGDYKTGGTLWQQSLKEMDDAVKLEPQNIGVRIPRATCLIPSSRFVPAAMQRPLVERARDDFEMVYSVQKLGLAKMALHSRGELLMGLAEAYERLGDREKAATTLNLVTTACASTPYMTEAQSWLKAPGSGDSAAPHYHNCIGCHE